MKKDKSKKIDTKSIDQESRRLSGLIADLNLPIDNYINQLLDFMSIQKTGQDIYGMLVRNAFGVGKNASNADPKKWQDLLNRVETILGIVNQKGSIFAKVIFNESMGHRYSDCWFETKHEQYEVKMKQCYVFSHEQSKLANLYKNIDSTMFWLAVAYHRMGRFADAKYYYKIVADRGEPRFLKSSFVNKILLSFIYSQDLVDLIPHTTISQILDRHNSTIGQIYSSFQTSKTSNTKLTNMRLIKFIIYWDSIPVRTNLNALIIKNFLEHQ